MQLNTTVLALAIGAMLVGVVGYVARLGGTLLYFGLMAIGAAALGYVLVRG